MRHLVVKELNELVRERRFAVFLTMLATVLGTGGMIMLAQSATAAAHGHAASFGDPLLALVLVGLASSTILALMLSADAIAKERDQGMLSLILTAPVTHAQVIAAKVATLGIAYAAYALVFLSVAGVLAFAYGWVVVKAAFLLVVGPLAGFYAFLAGLCLMLSAAFRTSRAALAVGAAVALPLFLLLKSGPFGYLLQQSHPKAHALLGWLPVEAAVHASVSLVRGMPVDWAPPAFSALLGVGFVVGALFAFRLREVGL